MVMPLVVVALGLFRFLFRRTYAKRLLAFGALRLRPPPHYLRLVEPLSRNEVDPDPGAASSLESVKKTIGTIQEAVGEMSSRQLGRPLNDPAHGGSVVQMNRWARDKGGSPRASIT